MANIESYFANGSGTGRLYRAGYGFFLGYTLLYTVILTNSLLAGAVSYSVVMISLLALASAGGLLLYRQNRSKPGQGPIGPTFKEHSRLEKTLLLVLMLWITIHLLFAAIELLTIPVYPWDAWLVWVYRAKAWFFAGNVTEMVSGNDWLNSAESAAYTVHAHAYPKLVSVIPFWAAVSLGSWSESLVNIPTLLCGVAIGMALYGQCRAIGISALLAITICYFLFSTPLFGTHMALAGYADIWMAGFAGLGFVALIRGLITQDRTQQVLGLGLITLSMLIKNEGVVWFFAALLFLLIIHAPWRKLVWLLAGILALAFLAYAFGVNKVSIPCS